jgi:hypothetical protein
LISAFLFGVVSCLLLSFVLTRPSPYRGTKGD